MRYNKLGATEVRLSSDELAALDKVSVLPLEYPGWMFDMQCGYRKEPIEASGQR